MELRQLTCFLAVAEELHFGRAAERLHVVQSAVSRQIQRLERDLGAELFDRSPRRVRLSGAGERPLPEARAVPAAADRAQAAVAAPAGPGADSTARTDRWPDARAERVPAVSAGVGEGGAAGRSWWLATPPRHLPEGCSGGPRGYEATCAFTRSEKVVSRVYTPG